MRNVQVRALLDSDGKPDFEIDGVKAANAKMHFPKGGNGDDIAFNLRDESGRGLRFDSADPLWVDENAPCPPTQGISTDQLTVKDCKPEKLFMNNLNSGPPRDLRYQLNFVADDGSRFICDPIIQNGGGGGTS
jgi:hypothetical protein